MPDDLGQPKLGPHGGPRARGQRNPETRPTGVRRDYILRRLERDGRHDLAEAIREGRVSAYTIAVELGWTKRAEPISARTNAAKRRQHQLRVIAGELGPGQKMELIYGPSPAMGSYFDSREALQSAWVACRDELLARANPGRRPQAFYEFEFDGPRPQYDEERSTLWRMNLLPAEEKVVLEAEWKVEFEKARGMSAQERREHLTFHDVPDELVREWMAERRRRPRGITPSLLPPAEPLPHPTLPVRKKRTGAASRTP
jgi:hypothetical protein